MPASAGGNPGCGGALSSVPDRVSRRAWHPPGGDRPGRVPGGNWAHRGQRVPRTVRPGLGADRCRVAASRTAHQVGRRVAVWFDPGAGVPGLPGWQCIPTPGHTPGHVAFFRGGDRVLITGDAVLTVNLNSAYDFLAGKHRVSGPPYISTWNWPAAKESVAVLAEPGKALERFQPGAPYPVVECRLRHDGHITSQQQLQDTEEDGQCPHRQLVTWPGHKPGAGVHHPFLVPADRRAPHRRRDLVGKRRPARPRRTADNNECRKRSHPRSYNQDLSPCPGCACGI